MRSESRRESVRPGWVEEKGNEVEEGAQTGERSRDMGSKRGERKKRERGQR